MYIFVALGIPFVPIFSFSPPKTSTLYLSFFFFSHPQKHKRKNHCDDKNNDSSGNLADLSSNEDDVNVINGSFEKLQVDKAYEVKYSDVYGRLEKI